MSRTYSFASALKWLDEHIVLILAAFLMAFIPLYPKIPLWSPIEQYIVRVRLEDLFIFATVVVVGIQTLRKKVQWYSPMVWVVLAYVIVGLLSTLHAMYIIKTVPLQPLHVGKTILHYFRYLEYFSLFFILFAAVKKRSHVTLILGVFTLTVIIISLYGYGQRYFYWPVYSTMNREFSKGVRLYLTQYARVQSTFGGHYDMAAYLVTTLPLLLAFAFQAVTKWKRWFIYTSFWLGTWLLIMSASRTPFAAYLVGVAVVVLVSALVKPGWAAKFNFAFKKGLSILLCIGILFYYFGGDLSERLVPVIEASPQLSQAAKVITNTRKAIIPDWVIDKIPLSPQSLQALLPKSKQAPEQGFSTDDLAAVIAQAVEDTKDVASSRDQPPVAVPDQTAVEPILPPLFQDELPAGVYEDIPDVVEVATISATGQTEIIRVARKRVYSKCALEKELSLCIRLETLWPRAIDRFLDSPILGTGYATLTKETVYVFTEADSTDNNFLRTLGETGILGFITFYGAVALVLFYAVKNVGSRHGLTSAVSAGMLGGSIGLLLNAVYIDVFAASKVAQTYWALCGLFMGYLAIQQPGRFQSEFPLVVSSPVVSRISPTRARRPKSTSRRSKTKQR